MSKADAKGRDAGLRDAAHLLDFFGHLKPDSPDVGKKYSVGFIASASSAGVAAGPR